jgi:hypothetical protein
MKHSPPTLPAGTVVIARFAVRFAARFVARVTACLAAAFIARATTHADRPERMQTSRKSNASVIYRS